MVKLSTPELLIAFRGVCAPAIFVLACFHFPGAVLAAVLVVAFLSDIFDGVIARRQGTATAELRSADTIVDTVFFVSAAIALMRGDLEAESRLAAAVAKGPVTLREIDTARLYGDADNPRMAAVHLDRLFRADPSCTAFIEQSPAFVELRKHAVIQDVIRRHRKP